MEYTQSSRRSLEEMILSINNTLKSLLRDALPKNDYDLERTLLETSVPLYVITPTYPRMTQLSEITRTGQVLKVIILSGFTYTTFDRTGHCR